MSPTPGGLVTTRRTLSAGADWAWSFSSTSRYLCVGSADGVITVCIPPHVFRLLVKRVSSFPLCGMSGYVIVHGRIQVWDLKETKPASILHVS